MSNDTYRDGMDQPEIARIVLEWDDSGRSLSSLVSDMREALGDDAEIIDARTTKEVGRDVE